jgi:type IV pilus assembly protein PilV
MSLFKQKGHGLIETIVALLIISGGVITLIQFERQIAYHHNLAQQKSEATILATSQIESLRAFGVINTTPGYTSYQSIATGTSTSNGANTTYTLNWTVTTSTTNPTYKTVNVTTTWLDRYSASQSVQLSTIILGLDPVLQASVI